MATVTGLTAERMQEIIDSTIVDADVVSGHLILTLHDGSTIDAGLVTTGKGSAFPASPTDGDLFVRTDQTLDPLYEFKDGAWALVASSTGAGVAKVTAFPTVPPPTDGDLVVRTDQVGDPLYKFTDGVWERQPRMGAQTVPFLKARASAAQSIPTGVWTSVNFDLEDADTDTLHSTVSNTNRITVNTPGVYTFSASIGFVPGTGVRSIRFIKNGDPTIPLAISEGLDPPDASNSGATVSTHIRLAAGDYVEVQVYQNSGGALNTLTGSQTTNQVAAVWLGGAGQTVDERGVSSGQIIKTSAAIQGIPNTTYTPFTFNTTGFDTDGMTLVANRLTIKTPGLYRIIAEVDWTANTTGSRQIALRKNNGSYLGFVQGPPGAAGGGTYQQVTADVLLAAGDFITLEGWQSSTVSLNVDGAWLSAVLVGSGKTVTPFARAWTAGTVIPNNADTAISLASEASDNDSIHDTVTNNTRFVCKTAGVYQISGTATFQGNANGQRIVKLFKNGSYELARDTKQTAPATVATAASVSSAVELAVGDYIELIAYQDSGGSLNILGGTDGGAGVGNLSMVKVGAPNAPSTGVDIVEGWHTVGAAGEPAFLNATVAIRPIRFRRDRGVVRFEPGSYIQGPGSPTPMFTLPLGYRPTYDVIVWGVDNTGGQVKLTVLPDGSVLTSANKLGGGWVDLANIRFDHV